MWHRDARRRQTYHQTTTCSVYAYSFIDIDAPSLLIDVGHDLIAPVTEGIISVKRLVHLPTLRPLVQNGSKIDITGQTLKAAWQTISMHAWRCCDPRNLILMRWRRYTDSPLPPSSGPEARKATPMLFLAEISVGAEAAMFLSALF